MVKQYVSKWSDKYPPEIIVKGIQNKLGFNATYADGIYNIDRVGSFAA